MLHTLLGSFHNLDAAIVDVLVDQGKDLLFFLVDILDFLRDYELFLGSVLVDVDQVHSIFLRYLEN